MPQLVSIFVKQNKKGKQNIFPLPFPTSSMFFKTF